jgi:hypothetical protein
MYIRYIVISLIAENDSVRHIKTRKNEIIRYFRGFKPRPRLHATGAWQIIVNDFRPIAVTDFSELYRLVKQTPQLEDRDLEYWFKKT